MSAEISVDMPIAAEECEPQIAVIRRVAEALARDERVTACWLHGSFASGAADASSDIDLEAAAEPDLIAEAVADPSGTMSQGGQVLVAWGGGAHAWARLGAILTGPVLLDLALYHVPEHPIPRRGVPVHLLFDRAGLLAEPAAYSDAVATDAHTHRGDVEDRLRFFWFWTLTALRFLRRGNLAWASGFLGDMRAVLTQLLWLSDNAGACIAFPVACAWGPVRTDLSPEAGSRLADALGIADPRELLAAIERCADVFSAAGRHLAARLAVEYPGALEDEVRRYSAAVCDALNRAGEPVR